MQRAGCYKALMTDLTVERLKELVTYDPDTGVFLWKMRPGSGRAINSWNAKNAGKQAGYYSAPGYMKMKIEGKRYWAHRVAWLYCTGA